MRQYSIYIHIPFCVAKCNYCDFNSYANSEEYIEKYVESLIKEIDNDNSFSKLDICRTIYIGGGTPSYISSKYIVKVLEHIFRKYNVASDSEITIEQNPSSITKEKLQDYYKARVNRLSIGLQSTNDRLLQNIGRKHSYDMFLEKYNLARDVGFDNINVDLMLGLPNSTLDDVKQDITNVIALNPEHISCYSLILYDNVPLYRMIESKVYSLPNEDVERQMYYTVKKYLQEASYIHYEISNFSKVKKESKHNMMCWNQYEYIGFGAGAHSFVNGIRFKNEDDIQKYIMDNRSCVLENMDKEQLMNEYMLLGLRLIDGIDAKRFKQLYNEDMFEYFKLQLNYLQKEGYINIQKGDKLQLTDKGIDFNNIVCQQFII